MTMSRSPASRRRAAAAQMRSRAARARSGSAVTLYGWNQRWNSERFRAAWRIRATGRRAHRPHGHPRPRGRGEQVGLRHVPHAALAGRGQHRRPGQRPRPCRPGPGPAAASPAGRRTAARADRRGSSGTRGRRAGPPGRSCCGGTRTSAGRRPARPPACRRPPARTRTPRACTPGRRRSRARTSGCRPPGAPGRPGWRRRCRARTSTGRRPASVPGSTASQSLVEPGVVGRDELGVGSAAVVVAGVEEQVPDHRPRGGHVVAGEQRRAGGR